MPCTSIIIVTWNSQNELKDCISSLLIHVPPEDIEVILVDNGSKNSRYLDVYRGMKNVVVIENSENLGFSKAVNIGLSSATGEYLTILNPDIIFQSNPFPRLIYHTKNNRNIGVIGPLLKNIDGNVQSVAYYPPFPSVLQYLLRYTILARLQLAKLLARHFFQVKINTSGLTCVDQIPGAFLFFRRDAFPIEPILNEAYFIWMEDVDFCYRIHQTRRKVVVMAGERVVHVGGTSFKMKDGAWKRLAFLRSYLTYSGLYFDLSEYFIQSILMLLDSMAIILCTPIIMIKNGLENAIERIKLEVNIIKLVLVSVASYFRNLYKR